MHQSLPPVSLHKPLDQPHSARGRHHNQELHTCGLRKKTLKTQKVRQNEMSQKYIPHEGQLEEMYYSKKLSENQTNVDEKQ